MQGDSPLIRTDVPLIPRWNSLIITAGRNPAHGKSTRIGIDVQGERLTASRRYIQRIQQFGSNARWYLLFSMMSGFALGIIRLLFNFYVLSIGYESSVMGLLVGLPPLIITFAAIPMGILGHRVGFRLALMIGAGLMTTAMVGLSLSSAMVGLIAFSILRGFAMTLLQVSSAPFMAENSDVGERTHLFSVQFASRSMANFGGLLLAGVLPGIIAALLGVDPESTTAYRGAIMTGAAIYALSILPLLRTRVPETAFDRRMTFRWKEMFHPPGLLLKLFLPQVVIGFGAGALVPFLNVFFKTKFDMGDSWLGLLFAFQSGFMALATFSGPMLAERWGKVRSVIGVQLSSIPFLILLGYSPILSLSSVGFLLRAALMNAANPLYTAFAMEQVSAKQRGTASALMQMSWQGTRSISSFMSGALQEVSGFTLLFPITIVMYLSTSILMYLFFARNKAENHRT